RQHVVDARALEHGADGTAGDDAGARAGWLEQHHAGRVLALHGVRDRAADPGHAEEALLGRLDALGDRRGHLLGLAVADPDEPVAVADDHERGEAEAPAALDDLGHPVDGHDLLQVSGAPVGRAAAAVVTTVSSLAAASCAASRCWWH